MNETNKWISVEEGLPKDGEIVMTYGTGCAYSEYCQAYFHYFGGDINSPVWQELDCCGDFFDSNPTHWMPLPSPPNIG